MHVAVRPYLTAGVALVGAGAIIASPVRPSIPDVHIPALNTSSVAVELTAMANPIGQWMEVFGTAFNNVAQIGGAVVSDPAPLLRQIIANQIGYSQTIVTGLMGAGVALNNYVTVEVPAALQAMGAQISQGDIVGATTTLINTFSNVVLVGFPLFPLVNIPGKITDNLTSLVHAATGIGTLLNLVLGVMNPVKSTMAAAGDLGQAFVSAMGVGDPVTALNALINAPAVLTGALLNGYTSSAGATFGGLLSYGEVLGTGGIIQTLLVTLPRMLAAAIAPPQPPAPEEIAAPASIASIPAVTAMTVALDAAPPALQDEAASVAAGATEAEAGTPATGETTVETPAIDETTVETAATDETAVETPATDETTIETPVTDESDSAGQPVAIKDGNKAIPGDVTSGVDADDPSPATPTLPMATKSFSDEVSSALGKPGLDEPASEKAAASGGVASSASGSTGGGDE